MKFSHSIGMCEAPAVGKCRKTCVKIKNNRGKNRKQGLLNQLVPFDETCVFFFAWEMITVEEGMPLASRLSDDDGNGWRSTDLLSAVKTKTDHRSNDRQIDFLIILYNVRWPTSAVLEISLWLFCFGVCIESFWGRRGSHFRFRLLDSHNFMHDQPARDPSTL